MWATVLITAIAVIFEPIRIGFVVLMLHRRRPVLQLLAFLCGGFTMGIGVGLVVLFVLRATPVAAKFSLAEVQIANGLFALLIAVVLATNFSPRKLKRRLLTAAPIEDNAGIVLVEPRPPGSPSRLSIRTRHLLQSNSLCIAGVSGAGTALPSTNYMCAMAAILASGATPVTQIQALLTFNVVAFTFVQIPLMSYLAAPHWTRTYMTALQARLQSRRYRDIAALVAAGGIFMLALGVSGL